ncbi:MAG: sigma-54-dependent Fis family transcriptional regulator [Deltaproteobacteria bacterium]|nr:sigma-54-dependent Fis family transcriptional regulator [Deltaproteobacteria bacterium]
MAEGALEFSEAQWTFLSVLEAFGQPISIELAGNLAPLFPGPLINLLGRAEALGWLARIGPDRLCIGRDLPKDVKLKLRAINTPGRLSSLVERIRSENQAEQLEADVMIRLLEGAGRIGEAGEIEYDLAQAAIEGNNLEKGRTLLLNCVSRFQNSPRDANSGTLYIAAVLQLSSLAFALGKGLSEIDGFLHKAHEIATELGDKRSHALINLHLGRLYYFTDRRDDALVALSLGTEEIESLGDEDIHSQSAPFLGLYYFAQGRFREAFAHLEKAELLFESSATPFLVHPMTHLFVGYCATYLGQFHRAIGSLDHYWRLSRELPDKALSSTIRAVLGMILVRIKKPRKASAHLQQAFKESMETNNAIGLYFCGGGMALQHFLDGRISEAYQLLKQTVAEGSRAGIVRQFSSPWILEMLYEFHRLGFEPIPDFGYSETVEKVLGGVNCHLQGVAFRLRAKDHLIQSAQRSLISEDLTRSAECLRKSGDPVELSKTMLEMARMELMAGDRKKARIIAHEARRLLGGYTEEFFPKEFQHLVENEPEPTPIADSNEAFFESFLAMIESLYPSESRTEIMAKVLTATSDMFGAERSGLFWFPSGRATDHPDLRAASSLSAIEINSKNFQPSLDRIIKAYKTKTPLIDTLHIKEFAMGKKTIRSVLCIPVEVQGLVNGVLYYDNAYLDNAFAFIDLSMAKRLMSHTNMVIERRLAHLKMKEQVSLLSSEKSLRQESENHEIITRSSIMLSLMSQIDQISGIESTILLMGETGTGKELFAKYIHHKSARADGPFVIVDSTTIPENLLESELFGHEKGAFTGADQRKIGRIEIAHQGTLFLDEVGELTLPAQAKLLRALQEKTFNRVGGIQTLSSDFRLITATNRDLSREVARGRFRQDLYYRLNVVPLTLPPLRNREKDAVLLAKHFIAHYAKKYNRQFSPLTPEDEKLISTYSWPGNIRELKNIIERAVILSQGKLFELNMPARQSMVAADPFSDRPTLDEIQRRYINYVIQHTEGKISGPDGAAEILGMKRTSLYTRMKALKMRNKMSIS